MKLNKNKIPHSNKKSAVIFNVNIEFEDVIIFFLSGKIVINRYVITLDIIEKIRNCINPDDKNNAHIETKNRLRIIKHLLKECLLFKYS